MAENHKNGLEETGVLKGLESSAVGWKAASSLSRDEFNIKVLQAFVELHEFADLNLVQALR